MLVFSLTHLDRLWFDVCIRRKGKRKPRSQRQDGCGRGRHSGQPFPLPRPPCPNAGSTCTRRRRASVRRRPCGSPKREQAFSSLVGTKGEVRPSLRSSSGPVGRERRSSSSRQTLGEAWGALLEVKSTVDGVASASARGCALCGAALRDSGGEELGADFAFSVHRSLVSEMKEVVAILQEKVGAHGIDYLIQTQGQTRRLQYLATPRRSFVTFPHLARQDRKWALFYQFRRARITLCDPGERARERAES